MPEKSDNLMLGATAVDKKQLKPTDRLACIEDVIVVRML